MTPRNRAPRTPRSRRQRLDDLGVSFGQVSARGDLPRRSWTGEAIAGSYPVPSASTWKQAAASAFTIIGSGDIAPLVGDIVRTTFVASPRRGHVLAANGSYFFPQSGPTWPGSCPSPTW